MIDRLSENLKFNILVTYNLLLIVFSFIFDNYKNILLGINKIIRSSDILITDYLGIGGLGATFFNAGMLGLLALFLLKVEKSKLNGISIAAVFTVTGFAMFGKNSLNICPIMIGVWLHSAYQKEPFANYVIVALFGTALAPMVSQIIIIFGFSAKGVILGTLIGIIIGFILPPVASSLLNVHQGFNLYNLGFTAGVIGTLLMSVFRSYEFDTDNQLIWTVEYTKLIGAFLILYFLSMMILGYILNEKSIKEIKRLWERSGRTVTDFVIRDGFALTLFNMGIMGLLYTLLILVLGSPLNGPVVGGLFTIVGFSAFGKHPLNTIPVVLGVLLGVLTNVWDLSNPALILALLFSTTLAPITGVFGNISGIIAGFLHLSVVMNIGYLHGGLNLYNNGFSGGLVASILFPIFDSLRRDG
ncbi:uncharacterized protein DUF1576 [Orenia metallireducens]|jgi:hypothetical protein|uniref:DUF1576 domain-containing protein n=1 Tax=Orenia metallireducens TaxID=1413210 RepID=A0A285GZX5_9FIRM|nr:DUF1576 domain-containing protein [Orenia metallireducens]PRX21806.1 uncharacterized protein DUF1576 [Orenia metallireducens]SNY29129.1 Protein of unknown function [Orenia metallireducens]